MNTPDYGLERVQAEMTQAQRDRYLAHSEIALALTSHAVHLAARGIRQATIRMIEAKADDYHRYMSRMYWKMCRQIAAKAKKQEGAER